MSKGRRNRRGHRKQGGNQAPAKSVEAPLACATLPSPAALRVKRAMAPAAQLLDHRFNDDLLISEHDQHLARTKYPEIYHVLDHPELREQFQRYDDIANNAKLWVQHIGLLAVLLAVLALFGSALTPLLHQSPGVPEWMSTALFWAEVGGIVGVYIAAGGMWIAGIRPVNHVFSSA